MLFTLLKSEGKISNGLIDYLKQLPDGKYRVEVDKYRKARSTNQNKLYWAYLRLLSDETGNDENNLHSYFKRKHLPPRFVEVLGKEIKLPATTTTLSTSEFTEYIMRIEMETGINLPNEILI